MSTIVNTDSYGPMTIRLHNWLKKHNVSPSDFTDIHGLFGEDEGSIRQFVEQHSRNGMYYAPWPFPSRA